MDIDAASTVQATSNTAEMLKSFVEDGFTDKAALARLLESDPDEFCRAAVGLLAGAAPSTGYRYVVHLLLKHGLLIRALADTDNCRLNEAVTIVKSLTNIGSSVEPELERRLSAMLQQAPSPSVSTRIHRLMELLSEVSKNGFLLFQSELITYPDPTVRATAVLLIGRAGRNADLMGRMLLDPDPRVQANAVEALWIFKEDACKPMFLTAAKSKHHRVAGNAMVGLYRIAEIRSVPMLLEMIQNRDLAFRVAAIWAMGETGDPRFVPRLTEAYRECTGEERLAALRALARIRNRTVARSSQPAAEVRIGRSERRPDGSRQLIFKLSSARTANFQNLKATDFAVWEGEKLVLDYSVTIPSKSVLLASGFVVPRILSIADPYRLAISDALTRCVGPKRPDDVWRIDRYAVEEQGAAGNITRQNSTSPYDDVVLGANVKTQYGFISAPEPLNKLIAAIGSRERSAADLLTGMERVTEAVAKHSGKRHLFLFLHEASTEWPVSVARMQQFAEFVERERIVLHGFAGRESGQWSHLQEICLSGKGGSFSICTVEDFAATVEKRYAELTSQFEISYISPGEASSGVQGSLVISSDLGSGQTLF